MVVNDLSEFRNEQVDIAEFLWTKPGHQEPDAAYVLADVVGGKVRIDIYEEDRKAIVKAGYTIASDSERQQLIPVILGPNRRIDCVIGTNDEEVEVERRNTRPYKPLHGQPVGTPRTEATDGTAALKLVVPEPILNGMASLYSKIAQVMGKIGSVQERGVVTMKEQGRGYTYITDGDLYAAVRQEMAAANLAMLPPRLIGKRAEKDGEYIDIEFTLACGDTGATLVTPWFGRLGNTGDKAIHATMTMCTKYFLKYTFLISTENTDDADAESSSSGPKTTGQRKATAPRKADSRPATAQKVEQVDASGAPAMVIAKIKTDKGVQAAWQSSNEATNTINAMWREGELQDDMDDAEKVKRVIERLQSHQVAPPTGGKGEARPWKTGERTTFAEAAQVDGLNERDWLAALSVEKLDEWQGTFSEARTALGAYVSAQIGGAK